ncbi:MAG: NfeD family protein [Paracoccaceae bacterium]
MELFAFLHGISPWWWVAFGVALGVLEMATMSFFLIWPAIASLFIAVLIWLAPGLSGTTQIIVFAILSVALTFAGRGLINRFGDGGEDAEGLNSRALKMVGRQAKVLKYTGPEGSVSIDGTHWRAIWPEGSSADPGATVTIIGAEGMTLYVE